MSVVPERQDGKGSSIVGLILARGGSKGIPGKNKRILAGSPLIVWVLRPMKDCTKFSGIWVSTDDKDISDVSKQWNVNVHHRDSSAAKDCTSSLQAVQEFINHHPEINVIALVQCTSPCLHPSYLEKACSMILYQQYDSVFSVIRQHKLRWKEVSEGENTEPLNFNPYCRPRRQDWPGELIESGHFYFAKTSLIQNGLIQGGKCGYVEIPQEMCIEVDTEVDWIIAEEIIKKYGYKGKFVTGHMGSQKK